MRQIPHATDTTTQVEEALKQNMASFADHILESIVEPYHRSSSTTTERRYGKKGHIAVNLRTGAWIDYKDSSLSGGPLYLLTKLKGLSLKEALEYGASWAGLDPEKRNFSLTLTSQEHKKENLEKKAEISKKIEKAQALWRKRKSIQGTLAERYLREHRNIKEELPQDLRYLRKISRNILILFFSFHNLPYLFALPLMEG